MQKEESSSQNQSYNYTFIGQKDNVYSFQTLSSVTYEIKFRPTPYLFGEDSIFAPYSFELIIEVAENPTGKRPVFDTKVSRTVASIFEDFYLNNDQNITVYICESADNRQNIRKTKFDRWFEYFAPVDYNKYDAGIKDSSGIVYPVSLILKETNPNRATIISEFINIISGYNIGK
jgi:Family of unknown function (DUF6169)